MTINLTAVQIFLTAFTIGGFATPVGIGLLLPPDASPTGGFFSASVKGVLGAFAAIGAMTSRRRNILAASGFRGVGAGVLCIAVPPAAGWG